MKVVKIMHDGWGESSQDSSRVLEGDGDGVPRETEILNLAQLWVADGQEQGCLQEIINYLHETCAECREVIETDVNFT